MFLFFLIASHHVLAAFARTLPNQDKAVFDIVQYLDDPRQATSRGQLVISPLPPHQRSYPIEVEVHNLEDGTLDVRAYDPHTRQKFATTFGQDSQVSG